MTAPTVATATTAETAQYGLEAATAARAAQLAIRAAAMRDAVRLWPLLDKNRLSDTFPGWLRAMTLLVARYHGQSSTVAATFYRSARAQALQSPTPTSLIKLAPEPAPEWLSKAFGFSGPGMLSKDTAQPGTALSTTLGTTARVVLDGGRTTTLDTVRADPAAIGWFRVTDGDPCAFCALLASRGVVYKKDTVDFKAHNDCGCSGAPAFSRDQALPDIAREAADVYANRGSGDAMTAFRKAWAARNSNGAAAS
jgi:hypothetical protein